MNLLFVCTGNTCRSPMAQVLFEDICRRAGAAITVRSAGLMADGSPASAPAAQEMARRGLSLQEHVSQPVTATLCEAADLLVAMSPSHIAALHGVFGVPLIKLRLMGQGIPDPYGGSAEDYRLAADALAAACETLWEDLTAPATTAAMTAEEIPALAELERLCFSEPWSESGLAEELENPCAAFVTAHSAGGYTVGYAGLHAVADEGAVTNVAVHPAYRRQGVGRALVRALRSIGTQRGLARITLEVRPSNAAAVALYESEGFVCDGVRPGFYTSPKEDARLYSLYFDKKE